MSYSVRCLDARVGSMTARAFVHSNGLLRVLLLKDGTILREVSCDILPLFLEGEDDEALEYKGAYDEPDDQCSESYADGFETEGR